MKAVIFGSTGNVSKQLATKLAKDGVETVVITRSANKVEEIKAFGAIPAVGDINDEEFLLSTLKGADSVFVLIPLPLAVANFFKVINKQMELIVDVILKFKVPNVVYLSSIGAHKPGIGGLDFHYYNEQILKNKLNGVLNSLTIVRPSRFYTGLLVNLPEIEKGEINSFLDKEKVHSYVSLDDMADIISDIIEHPPKRGKDDETISKTIYVESDRITVHELTKLYAKVFDKPDLKWNFISIDKAAEEMAKHGFNKDTISSIFTSLSPSSHDELHSELYSNRDDVTVIKGKHPLEELITQMKNTK
ncbi:hypothetical protein DAPK24_007340 [Pichia kluyveri]|uniref:NmrA-like domain-containing protein n=1 Tax=Pichia kluyveri TaxID=36015 RepID=A0AAV5QYB9_PICKL|nr:hypothetical protein DAPK24_007340 [Pichia kluyveri]